LFLLKNKIILSKSLIEKISVKLKEIKLLVDLNSGEDLEIIRDELLSIIQEIDIEKHRCFNHNS